MKMKYILWLLPSPVTVLLLFWSDSEASHPVRPAGVSGMFDAILRENRVHSACSGGWSGSDPDLFHMMGCQYQCSEVPVMVRLMGRAAWESLWKCLFCAGGSSGAFICYSILLSYYEVQWERLTLHCLREMCRRLISILCSALFYSSGKASVILFYWEKLSFDRREERNMTETMKRSCMKRGKQSTSC